MPSVPSLPKRGSDKESAQRRQGPGPEDPHPDRARHRRLRCLRRRQAAPREAHAPGRDWHEVRKRGRGFVVGRLARPRRGTDGKSWPRRSGCTSWPSRTPSTPTSGRSWNATTTLPVPGAADRPLRRPRVGGDGISEIVETGEIMVFVGADFVITVRHGDAFRAGRGPPRAGGEPERLALGPAAVLHAIADHVVDNYLEVTQAIEEDIDEHGGRGVLPAQRASRRTDLPAQARDRASSGGPVNAAVDPAAAADVGHRQSGAEGDPPLLPRRPRPPHQVAERIAEYDELAQLARRRRPGQDRHAAEHRHAQDLGVGGHRGRADRRSRASTA